MQTSTTISTLPQLLNASAAKYTDKIALTLLGGIQYTYTELKNKVALIATFLQDQGIAKGDRIALLGENHPHWGIAYLAINSFGATAVPIMNEFNPHEVHHILRHSGAKAVFVSAKLSPKIEEAEVEDLNLRILIDDFSIIPNDFNKGLIKKAMAEAKKEFEKVKVAAMKFVGLLDDAVTPDDLACIVYTSGTTGHSKGVMLTHRNIVANVKSVTEMSRVMDEDVFLSIMPLAHTMECTLGMLTPINAGATVYYLDKPANASSLLPALAVVKPTIMIAVPLIIEKIYRQRILPEIQKKFITRALFKVPVMRKKIHGVASQKLYKSFGGRLKMLCIGGAPLSDDVEHFLADGKFPYSVGYGLTETAPLATGNHTSTYRYRSVGQPIPKVEIKIAITNAEKGEGEVLIKGDNVMQGYYKAPDKTAEIFTEDGWFKSGDLGYIDKDGFLFIRGRIKNMLLGANGKNIYPEELESVINEQEFVIESLIVMRDNMLTALIHPDYKRLDEEYLPKNLSEKQTRTEIQNLLQKIVADANTKLSSYAQIKRYEEQIDPFEKTPTLKIKRYLYK